MRKVLITPATFSPMEVDKVKLRPELRLTTATDDLILADFIKSAVRAYEQYTNNVLCSSVWDLYFDGFPDEINTPSPLVAVTSISYLDSAAATQTLGSTVYKLDSTNPMYGRITLRNGEVWPTTASETNSVIIRCTLGYENPNAIPPDIIDGMVAKLQELYYAVDMKAHYQISWSDYRRIPV